MDEQKPTPGATDQPDQNDISALQAQLLQQADFFAGISHEIRTPLTAILGYAESLLDSDM